MRAAEANFCLRCGAALQNEQQFGRPRPTCPTCRWVYFADPKVAVAVMVECGDQVLLVRRIHDPGRGLWTLPGGFMDAGEDPARAGERECLEETGLSVRVTRLLDVIAAQEHPRGANILIVYQAEWIAGEVACGDDADAAQFFSRTALPELAFDATRRLLAGVPPGASVG